MLLFAAFLFAELFLTVTGKTYNMLQLAWFTDAGEVVSSTDVFTSLIIVPIAVDQEDISQNRYSPLQLRLVRLTFFFNLRL